MNVPFRIGDETWNFEERTRIMGVLNVTPDSFSDGGRYASPEAALERALAMQEEGADLIDVGGESMRPGSSRVPFEIEINRVVPVVTLLRKRLSIPVSIDTYKAAVAEACLQAGAQMVNDISGLTFDRKMAEVVSRHQVPVVLMHTSGDPKVMQQHVHYDDVVLNLKGFFKERVRFCAQAGIPPERVLLDPGIGFGKTPAHSLLLLKKLRSFAGIAGGLLVGVSRKSFIGAVLGLPVEDRLEGSLASTAAAILGGAGVIRTHDIKETARVGRMCDAIMGRPFTPQTLPAGAGGERAT